MSKSDRPGWDSLWINVRLMTMAAQNDFGIIEDGAIAVQDGKIAWLGARSELPADTHATNVHDGHGDWLTPGLIDCHTHIIYAGNRSDEFEARQGGVSYAEISHRGGGIRASVRATRAASENELLVQSLPRLKALLAEGVTSIEIKSGYGLDLENEAKMLRAARRVGRELPLRVRTTFLGAHALPPEFEGRAEAYIRFLSEAVLPALHREGLVDAVDAFCESIGFSAEQTEIIFKAARTAGLPVKLHAEQLSDQSGAQLVARYQGLSADHLEYLSDAGVAAMASAGTVAVLLPGAFYFLRETRLPPIEKLREAAVPMAVSTDCNPGTSPLTSLLTTMNFACILFGLTPLEALQGVTLHAAKALGLADQIGTLEVDKQADFALWRIDRPADLAYGIGNNPCRGVVNGGRLRSPGDFEKP